MKKLGRVLVLFGLLLACLGLLPNHQALAANWSFANWQYSASVLAVEQPRVNEADEKLGEIGDKLDLNNSNIRFFRDYRGMFPTLAKKIIKNAPFKKVEDVFEMPGLSDRQKDILKANIDNFTVTAPKSSLLEGQKRLNVGIYD